MANAHNLMVAKPTTFPKGFVCLLILMGCTDKTRLIEGQVVDKSGVGISNAAVYTSYIGSGWSDDPVWGAVSIGEGLYGS